MYDIFFNYWKLYNLCNIIKNIKWYTSISFTYKKEAKGQELFIDDCLNIFIKQV